MQQPFMHAINKSLTEFKKIESILTALPNAYYIYLSTYLSADDNLSLC